MCQESDSFIDWPGFFDLGGLLHSYTNGLQDLPDAGSQRSSLNADDIGEKYKDALLYYSKVLYLRAGNILTLFLGQYSGQPRSGLCHVVVNIFNELSVQHQRAFLTKKLIVFSAFHLM